MTMFRKLHVLYPYQPTRNMNDVYIIGVQHLLETTGALIEQVVSWGVPARNIFLLGKVYSTHQDTLKRLSLLGISVKDTSSYFKPGYFDEIFRVDVAMMWQRLWQVLPEKATIIVLDDGGHTLTSIPEEITSGQYTVIGIEQTTSGIWKIGKNSQLPVIDVACSKAKRYLESPLISKALHRKIRHIIHKHQSRRIGVLGCGNIGKAIVKDLCRDYEIHVYDKDPQKISETEFTIKHQHIDELFLSCDTIIGTTGQDVSNMNWLNISNSNKLFISASSGDKEFNQLLREYVRLNGVAYPLDDLKLKTPKGYVFTFFRGGTVANFDGSAHSVSPDEIQLTRGLLYSALIMAVEMSCKKGLKDEIIPLEIELQKKVVGLWWLNHPEIKTNYSDQFIEIFTPK